MPFDPSQPFEIVSQPQQVSGSTFGWQNGPGSDSGDNGEFAGGGQSLNNPEDYAALPDEAGVQFGYTFPVSNPSTGKTVWVTRRDKGPAKWTGRGVDLAPSAMNKLGAQTDQPLTIDTKRAVPAFDPSKPFQVLAKAAPAPQASVPAAPMAPGDETDPSNPANYKLNEGDAPQPWYAKYVNAISGGQNASQADAQDAHIQAPVVAGLARDAAEAIDPSGALRARLMGPTDFPLPPAFETNKDDSLLKQAGKAVANAPSAAWNFASSPGGVATIGGIGALPAAGRSLVGYGFGSQMLGGALEDVNRGDTQGALDKLVMAALATKGGANEMRPGAPGAQRMDFAPDRATSIARQGEAAISSKPEVAEGDAFANATRPNVNPELGTQAPVREQAPDLRSMYQPEQAPIPEVQSKPQVSPVSRNAPISKEAPPEPSGDTVETGTNNRFFEQRYGEGDEGIIPGTIKHPNELRFDAQQRLANGAPINDVITKARTQGSISPEDYALLEQEHTRLVAETSDAHRIAEEAPTPENQQRAMEAEQIERDFAQNVLQEHKTGASTMFHLFQGTRDVPLDSLYGFRRAFRERVGREMTQQEAPHYKRIARDVSEAQRTADTTTVRTFEEAGKRFGRTPDVSFQEASRLLEESIANAVKDCGL